MILSTMAEASRDESDLTFKATLALNTVPEASGEEQDVEREHPRHQRHVFCTIDMVTGHKTLLLGLVTFIFFVLLITLLETMLPGKTGILSHLSGVVSCANGTCEFGGK